MNLELVGLLLLALAEIVVVIWAMVDAVGRPGSAWKRAGQHKVLWVALQPLGLVYIVGLVIPAVYFAFIRPSVRRAEAAATAGPATTAGAVSGCRPELSIQRTTDSDSGSTPGTSR